jgi:hypothetical protein
MPRKDTVSRLRLASSKTNRSAWTRLNFSGVSHPGSCNPRKQKPAGITTAGFRILAAGLGLSTAIDSVVSPGS